MIDGQGLRLEGQWKLPGFPRIAVLLDAYRFYRPGNVAVPIASTISVITHTALGEWNRYALVDDGVSGRTIWVDNIHVSATDFHIDTNSQNARSSVGRHRWRSSVSVDQVRASTSGSGERSRRVGISRRKPAINGFSITFGDRVQGAETH